MSISLPNGTLLATPAAQTQYTAAVTRILHLSSFPAELKTRDLQAMFKEYEGEKGGFRIKWVDDVNALVVFVDAGVAKRAYLNFLLYPPMAFPAPAKIRPYDRPDAAQIIQTLTARTMGHRSSMSNAISTSGGLHTVQPGQPSIDGLPGFHSRAMSMSNGMNPSSATSSAPTIPGTIGGGMGAFAFPKSGTGRPMSGLASRTQVATGAGHGRSGSGSASFSRQAGSGLGALNFGGSRLPTHAESLDSPARPSAPFPVRRTTKEMEQSRSNESSDTSTEAIVVMDHAPLSGGVPLGLGLGADPIPGGGSGFGQWKMPSKAGGGARRESMSAEKAMREVEKALAGVEAR
ncbi:uncharacterized protein MKK02DRAFT_33300 [Dioszegia hungarica]|uniref:Uncharacterized protein n=1 Tax=Dioszegia hungarica TaxID=4972 RepID=A0AA38HAW3_9TREE|nr:uncharacterized protein MKK02DRAFT_33300 [Dioszegia hungarica]KAI9636004.1 hypothetical protein MKK02DRAFT_33300 [Dioszegia hungarica]